MVSRQPDWLQWGGDRPGFAGVDAGAQEERGQPGQEGRNSGAEPTQGHTYQLHLFYDRQVSGGGGRGVREGEGG